MIFICNLCNRFLPENTKSCKYCSSTDFTPFIHSLFDEYTNITINIENIEIEGKNYKIDKIIGKGGFSTIVKVIDENKTSYALKLPFLFDHEFTNNPSHTPDQISKSLKALHKEKSKCKGHGEHHLNIISSGTIDLINQSNENVNLPYILMEFAYTNLLRIIDSESKGNLYIPLTEKSVMINDIILSLMNFHELGSVHRDLSPDNILLVSRNDEIHYVITDFGTTSDIQGESTQSSRIFAHNTYLDPIRTQDKTFRYDVTSDIWSISVIIAEILIGNFWNHYIKPSISQKLTSKSFRDYFLIPFKSCYDPDLFKILDKGTELNINKRFNSIQSYYNNIEPYLDRISSPDYIKITQFFNIHVHQKILVPIDFNNQKINLDYDGHNNIDINNFNDFSIKFKNINITNCYLQSTHMYQLKFTRDCVFLTFDQEYFKNRIHKYNDILSESTGYLEFEFYINISYIK